MESPQAQQEALHLKVRGVALWIKSLRGQATAVVDEAFETLLLAADALSTQQRDAARVGSPEATKQVPDADCAK